MFFLFICFIISTVLGAIYDIVDTDRLRRVVIDALVTIAQVISVSRFLEQAGMTNKIFIGITTVVVILIVTAMTAYSVNYYRKGK